jgi:antitoxin ParD1/3/4
MKVHLPKELQETIRQLVAAGRYPTESEAVADAVRLLQDREILRQAKLRQVQGLIKEGDESAKEGGWLEASDVFGWVRSEGRSRLTSGKRKRKRA